MPPKEQKTSKKTEQKIQNKIIEDKTFGLKNKNKSKTVQNFVKSVAAQVKGQNTKGGESKRLADEFADKAAKKKDEEKKALLASLFKTIKKTQEIEEEVPEEEVQEDNYEEIDLYTDQREQIYGKAEGERSEELESWHANKDKTDKICKFFLDSVEAGKYGWRWSCPNGITCIYKHALPLGYVLKNQQAVEVKTDDMTLEEKLEQDRAQLQGGTPVTLERFLKWKEDKRIQKEKEEKKRQDEAKKTAKSSNVLSGRALFTYDPTLFQDDAEALGDEEYAEEENRDDEEEKKEDDGVPEEDEEDEEDEPEGKEWGADNATNGSEQIKLEGETGEQAAAEKKKKKKKKNKPAEDENIQINEDVFLGEEDVELPEDDA